MLLSVNNVKNYLLELQQLICSTFETYEPSTIFRCDEWSRVEGGGGISCVLEDGSVLEKAGVNFSHIVGNNLPASASTLRPELAGYSYQALGVSVVVHPRNPYVPTTHMNIRLFVAEKPAAPTIWWFGGGFDLTPYYGFFEDCQHWHQIAKQICDPFGAEIYPEFKRWCDEYFFIRHRNEARGIGGIFFDDLSRWDFAQCFEFMQQVGNGFLTAYVPILEKRLTTPYSNRERTFQCYRRGRYVEFNLIYDRGTLFGLQSGGRTESILMSLPPTVNWRYAWEPERGSPEADLCEYFLKPREWLS